MPRRKSTPEAASAKKRRQRDIKLDRHIMLLQNTDIPLIPKLPFSRLVREIMQQYKEDYRITVTAMVREILQQKTKTVAQLPSHKSSSVAKKNPSVA